MKADITDLCIVANYRCANDGSGIVIDIAIGYQSVTDEWLDCVTFNLPAGWTYLPGSEIGTFSNAEGNYISDTGSSVTFGTVGFCPGGNSNMSVLGPSRNTFTFTIIPPAGWSAGNCDPSIIDGDPIVGITWDYFGDGYGEASASSPGNNGEATAPFGAIDMPSFPTICESTEIIPIAQSEITVCPQEQVSLGLDPSFQLGCVENYLVQFDDSMGGTGGQAGGFGIAFDAASFTFDAGLNGNLAANGIDDLSGTWCVTASIVSGFEVCTMSETLCITYLDTNDPICQNTITCTANFSSFTDECDFIVPGADCMLDDFITPGNTSFYEIFYETDGSTSLDGIVNATGTYTTGQDILNNLNSGFPGEVIFRGMPGDCDGIPKPQSVFCEPFTLDVYIVPIEYDAAGNAVAINSTCPVETLTILLNPAQEFLTYVETPGNCDTPATITIGFDFGDGAGNAPDGDLDDPEDAVCSVVESSLPTLPPCNGADNIETTPPLTATQLANLLGFANPNCYTDVAATAEAVCTPIPCPACDAEAPNLAIEQTTCPDGSMGGPISLVTSGGTSNSGEITEYFYSNDTGIITSFTTLAEAEAFIAGFAPEDEVCLNTITYVQAELDAVIAEIDICLGGLFSALFGIPANGNTFDGLYNAFINFAVASVTTTNLEELVAGMNGGPGMGGAANLDFLLPGLICPNIPPFCYQLNTLCITGVEDITCPTCDDPCANNTGETAPCTYDPDYNVCDDGCEFTTDTYNNTSCQCDFTLTVPDCDDNDPNTDDSYDEANCLCVNTSTSTFDFELSDPCNCFAGLDLDGDGQNEFATETYTFSNGTAPYMVSNITGTLYDNTGTPYTPATLEALIAANDPGTGADFDVVVYVDADGISTYSLEIGDSNGVLAQTMGGPCSICADASEVPTVGEWGLIMLALLMSIVALVGIRQRKMILKKS